MNPVKIFSRQTLFLYASRVSSIALQSIVFFVFAAVIGLEEFGIFSFVFSASQVLSVFLGMGGAPYLLRFLAHREAAGEKTGNSNFILACLLKTLALSVLVLVIIALVINLFHKEISDSLKDQLILILAISFLLSILEFIVSVVRINEKTTFSLVLRDCIPYLLLIPGFLPCMYYGLTSAQNLLNVYIFSLFISLFIGLFSIREYLTSRYKKNMTGKYLSDEANTFWGSGIVSVFSNQADILIARFFLGDLGLGIYSLLRKISNLISLPQTIANWSIYTSVARSFAENNREKLQSSADEGLIIAAPISLLLGVLMLILSPFWFGLFDIDLSSQILLSFFILSIAQLFNVFSGANLVFASQCREEKYVLRYRIYSAIAALLCISILGQFFGITGVSVGYTLSIILLNYKVSMHVRNKLGIETYVSPSRLFALAKTKT